MASSRTVAVLATLTEHQDGSGRLKIPGIGPAVKVAKVERFEHYQGRQDLTGMYLLRVKLPDGSTTVSLHYSPDREGQSAAHAQEREHFDALPLQQRREECLKLLRAIRLQPGLEPATHRTLATWAHHLVTACGWWWYVLKGQQDRPLSLGAEGLTDAQLQHVCRIVAAFDTAPETPDLLDALEIETRAVYEYVNTPPDQQQCFVPDLLLPQARQLWELKFPRTEAGLKPHPETVRKLARQVAAIQGDRGEPWTAHLCQVAWDTGAVLVTPVTP